MRFLQFPGAGCVPEAGCPRFLLLRCLQQRPLKHTAGQTGIEIDKPLLAILGSPVQRQRGVEPKPRQQRADRGDALCPSTPCQPSQSPGAEGLAASCCLAQDFWSCDTSVQSHRCCQSLGLALGAKTRLPQGQAAPTSPQEDCSKVQLCGMKAESFCSTEKLNFHVPAAISPSGYSVPKRRQWRRALQSPALLTEKQRLTCRL